MSGRRWRCTNATTRCVSGASRADQVVAARHSAGGGFNVPAFINAVPTIGWDGLWG
jgi:hypothetical protein